MSDDIWPVVHAERRALAVDLAGLTPEQWATPSMCTGWSVHDVLAHMVATAKETPPRFFVGMLTSGFRLSRMTEKRIAEERAGGPAATLAAFRAVETATSAPPGPKLSWLGEALVHAEDIRRPLGIAHEYPVASVTAVTDFYAGSNVLIGGKSRVAGVTPAGDGHRLVARQRAGRVRSGPCADARHHGPEGRARRAQRAGRGDPALALST